MGLTVQVSQTYKMGCHDCAAAVSAMVLAAVKDVQVTGIRLAVAPKCEHVTVGQRFPASGPLKGQAELPGIPRPTGYEQ